MSDATEPAEEEARRFRKLQRQGSRCPYVVAFVDRPVLVTWIEQDGRVVREQVIDPPDQRPPR